MSLTAIVNLAERLLNNSSSQSERHKLCRKAGSPAASAVSDPNAGDQFTPSQVSEADAGLFQVTQFNLFTTAAALLLSQTNPQAANPSGPPSQTRNAARQNVPQLSALPTVGSAAAATKNPTITSTASVEDQLQSPNTSLAALGLDPAEPAKSMASPALSKTTILRHSPASSINRSYSWSTGSTIRQRQHFSCCCEPGANQEIR